MRKQKKTMDKKKSIKTCKHNRLKQTGYWDGVRTGGPLVKCELCGKKLYITWEEWNAIPKAKKTPIEDMPKMKRRRKISEKTREAIEEVLKEPEIADMEHEEFVKRYNEFVEKMERNIKRRVKFKR